MNSQGEDLTVRNYCGEADIARVSTLYNACSRVDGPELAFTVADTRRLLTAPNTLPYENVFIFEDAGDVVAYGRVELGEGPDESLFWVRGAVHPDWRRQGIGSRLLDTLEERANQRLDEAASDTVYAETWTYLQHEDRQALFALKGYEPIRYGFEMERPLRKDGVPLDLPPAEYPAGIVVRTLAERPDTPATYAAIEEAFRDHWGHTESTFEEFEHWLANDPNDRPDWWLVAWDDQADEVAGVCMNEVNPNQNERKGRLDGWVDILAVRRPYRRQGLGRALLVDGLAILQEAGMDWALLGVDAENLTGALRLYESAGFETVKRSGTYRKVIRGG